MTGEQSQASPDHSEEAGSVLTQWSGLVGEATSRVHAAWGRSARDVAVTICLDDATFNAVATGLDGQTAGVTTAEGVFLAPAATRNLTKDGQIVVLAHELTHAVLGHVGQDKTALWVREGSAEWTAQQHVALSAAQIWPTLAQHIRDKRGISAPPARDAFEQDAALAYETAAAYMTYLADVAGRAKVTNFVHSRPDEPSAASAARELIPSNAPGWADWIAAQLRP